MCFYGIIYLKFGAGEKEKNFLCWPLIHLPLSDVKSAVRPAIVLFENYSYLFILLGGRRQKCLCIMTISLVLYDKNVYVL